MVSEYEAGRIGLRDVERYAMRLAGEMHFVNPNRKGKRYEREVAHDIERVLGGEAKRVPCSGGLDIKGDLRCFSNAFADWFIECKRQESLSVWKWIEKSRQQAGWRNWLLVFRRNEGQSHVILPLTDYLNTIRELQDLRAIVQGDEGETIQPQDAEGPDTGEDA